MFLTAKKREGEEEKLSRRCECRADDRRRDKEHARETNSSPAELLGSRSNEGTQEIPDKHLDIEDPGNGGGGRAKIQEEGREEDAETDGQGEDQRLLIKKYVFIFLKLERLFCMACVRLI